MKSIVQVVQNLIKPYIDNHDKANANLIAPVEVSPAEAAHSAGTQLIYDGKLYDVTAPIAIGDALATTGAGANISLSDDISTLLKNIKADYVGLYGEVEIDSATDLNTMQTIGNYYKTATNFAVTNAPTGIADDIQARFRLTVEKVLDSADSIILQILTAITGESYYRIYGGVSWGDWEEITTASAMADAIAAQAQAIFSVMGQMGAKNLLPNIFTSRTYNGITFTVNDDGSITADGTATALCSLNISGDIELDGDYILNGCPSGGGNSTYSVRLYDSASTNIGDDEGSGKAVTVSDLTCHVNLIIRNGVAVTNLVFKPMLRLAADNDSTYQPYAKTNQQLTAEINELEKAADGLIYGFQINGSESDPAAAVTYLEDAVGMTPAHMDFSTGKFDYGSWENAFFMPRPCMLKSDGTVDYYLNPDNYALKEDGVGQKRAQDLA